MSIIDFLRYRVYYFKWFGLGGPTRAYKEWMETDRPVRE